MARKSATMAFLAALVLSSGLPDIAAAGEPGESGEQAETSSEIVVVAPRRISGLGEDKGKQDRAKTFVSVSVFVFYEDLNLTQPKDVERLMGRVRSVAHDGCAYLDRLYPFDPDPDCERKAFIDAKPQADRVIAAAVAAAGDTVKEPEPDVSAQAN